MIKDWWNDTIVFYYGETIDSIKRFWERLGIWFSYWKITKRIYDFDYSGILEVEEHQIRRTMKAINKFRNHLYWWRDMKYMKIALHCLQVINRDLDYYELNCGGKSFKECLDNINSSNTRWILKRYVNTRNYKRFMSGLSDEAVKSLDECNLLAVELYAEKAYQLYCKIRREETRSWWD